MPPARTEWRRYPPRAVPARRSAAPSPRTRVRRVHRNAHYDRGTIDAILDAALVCHLGFVHDGQPYVIPTLHARIGDRLYVHGSSASRTLRTLASGAPMCATVTLIDGLVLARSVFEHSVNYRSVVVLGAATVVDDPSEKLTALQALTEQLLPGRNADARQPTRAELKATAALWLPLDEASAKVRTGPPSDGDTEDALLDVWAGEIPLVTKAGTPVPDPALRPGIRVPAYARRYRRPGLTG
jgi:nitroimidazol reductase NimA-like FMN-containing flavoprotein (pyridoxamine 5'-phosphate oxidase superfamily)